MKGDSLLLEVFETLTRVCNHCADNDCENCWSNDICKRIAAHFESGGENVEKSDFHIVTRNDKG